MYRLEGFSLLLLNIMVNNFKYAPALLEATAAHFNVLYYVLA